MSKIVALRDKVRAIKRRVRTNENEIMKRLTKLGNR